MRIIALLCWYDEHPAVLKRMIYSLRNFADTLIALDGPYKDFPHTFTHSPQEQHDALKHPTLEVYDLPARVWKTERHKRNHLLQQAFKIGTPGTDWILLIDADEELKNTKGARQFLAEHPDANCCSYRAITPSPDTNDPQTLEQLKAGTDLRSHENLPRLMRLDKTLRIEPPTHWEFTREINGERRRADTSEYTFVDMYVIHHTTARDKDRIGKKATYVSRRTASGEQ